MNRTAPTGEFHILLVEDNPDHSELIKRMLLRRGSGCEHVVVVEDGIQAYEYLLRRGEYADLPEELCPRPDLIFLDLKLPRMSGLELLERIKRHKTLCTIPVIVLTTSRDDRDVTRSYELGANSYIPKPADFKRFAVTLRGLKQYWFKACVLPDQV